MNSLCFASEHFLGNFDNQRNASFWIMRLAQLLHLKMPDENHKTY